jgi:hypothetical protein
MHRYFVVLKRIWVVIKILLVLVALVFLFLQKDICTITDLGEMNVNGRMFFVKKYVPVNKDEQELSKREVFIIIKRGKLRRHGGVFGEFIVEKWGKSIIYVVSLLDDEIGNRDSLIDTIHQLITNELGVKDKYYVVYYKPSQHIKGHFSEVVEKYCGKFKLDTVIGYVIIKPRSFFEDMKSIIFFRNRRGNYEEYRLWER